MIDLDALRRQFRQDAPTPLPPPSATDLLGGRIHGATATALHSATDHRGDLIELLTTRDGGVEPIVHVYQVWCEPGSVRAWVYHGSQDDRLCFTTGRFQIALFDLRPGSPTAGAMVTLDAGAAHPLRLRIPAFVAHGIKNCGDDRAAFVNLPTNVYRHATPDKFRLPANTPLIPNPW